MSVINRMLQELEERREDVMHSRLPGLVRAVPAQGVRMVKHLPWRPLLGAAIFILIAVLTWRLSSQWQTTRGGAPTLSRLPAAAPYVAPTASPQIGAATNTESTISLKSSAAVPNGAVRAGASVPAAPLTAQANTPRLGEQIGPGPQSAPPLQLRAGKAQQSPPAYPLARMPLATAASDIAGPKKTIAESTSPENINSEKTHSETTGTDKPGPLPEKAQGVELAAKDKTDIVKSAAGGDAPMSSMKQVSPEQRADFRYREALALITQGRSQEAQAVLADALRLDPKNIAARQVLLGLLLETKRYAEAEQLVQEALQANVAPLTHAMALARIQVERSDTAAALSTLEKYLGLANDNAAYHAFYAALLQRLGRHTDAISQFQTALRLQPNQATAWLGLGVSLQAEKRNTEAEQAYLRARAGNSLSPELLAFVEQRLKQVQAAR